MCKKLLYLISCVFLLGWVIGNTTEAQDDPSLIGWWKLDEKSGTVAADSSSHGNDGTVVGGEKWVSGYMDGALDFDGDDDYVDCGYDPIFDTAHEMTVAAWVTIRSIPAAWACVIAKGEYSWRISNYNTEQRYHFGITVWSQPNPSVDGVTVVGLDEWHHVAGVYNGASMNLYVDGSLDATKATTSPIGVNKANVLIGENPEAAKRKWDGLIDDVRLYNRALSEAEIGELIPTQLKATVPQPEDKSLYFTTEITLSWTAGETASGHHLYIGENYEDVENGTGDTDMDLMSQTSYSGYNWEIGKTYFWRVAEAMSDGTVIHPGDVWSFTIVPLTAFNPIPADGTEYVLTDVLLDWRGGFGSISDHVYFHTDETAVLARRPEADKGPVAVTEFSPGPLDYNTEYFWAVDEIAGKTTHTGSVWSFTTVGPNNGAKAEYFDNTDLSGDPVLTRLDPKIDFNWGTGSPDPLLSTSFSVRWTAEIEIPASDTYTFYSISDDNARLLIEGELLIDNWDSDNAWAFEDTGSIYLEAGRASLKMEYFNAGGDAIAQLKWQSSTIPRQIVSPGVLSLPIRASEPNPSNGATDVKSSIVLEWTQGCQAAQHDVYFGLDYNDVAQADVNTVGIYCGRQGLADTDYVPEEVPLEWGQTYYWRVDEINDLNPDRWWRGNVWRFTTGVFALVDDFEDYTDDRPNRIFETWRDKYPYTDEQGNEIEPGNGTGMIVGTETEPYGPERASELVHGDRQSLPLAYDNSVAPYYSETDRTFDDPQDWTQDNGHTLNTLGIHVRGRWDANNGFTVNGSTYTVVGSGADIWNTSDEFHYVYMPLPGDGSIKVRVDSLEDVDIWAKAGVMIRHTLNPDARNVCLDVTPDNLVEFITREVAGAASTSVTMDADSITLPHWLRLTRQGNTLTGEHSADDQTWDYVGDNSSISIPMFGDVYVGLAVTSRVDANTPCTAVFSNVEVTGTAGTTFTVSGDIGLPINDPADLYVAIEDATGAVKALYPHEDNPHAVLVQDWVEWLIPLSAFSDQGIDLTQVRKMIIGVGDKQPGGKGKLYIDDIRLYP